MSEQLAKEHADAPLRVLVIEDDASYGELLRFQLRKEKYEPIVARSGDEGLRLAQEIDPAIVLSDVNLPGKDGRQILEELKQVHPDLPIVIMTASGTIEMAVECMKRGAYDFLTKPFEIERLYAILRNAVQYRELKTRVNQLEGALAQRHAFDQMVAHAPNMRQVVDQAHRAALSDSDVLVLGESGTGKEVIARAIHFNSVRRKDPFVAINCGAIPEGLLESELFGHEKGAFTGAVTRREGCFEQADGGTLFLDEIGEMRTDMQVRLLRALEQREVRRVGGDRTIKVNVRVISATNQDLRARIKDGRFRSDLYYRLAILVLEIPPLRARPEDIMPLAQHFLHEAQREGHTRCSTIAGDAQEVLMKYAWPGNVRELRNAIERAVVFEDGTALGLNSFPPEMIRNVLGQQAVPEPRVTETYGPEQFRKLLAQSHEKTSDAPRAGASEAPASTSQPMLRPGAMPAPMGAVPVPITPMPFNPKAIGAPHGTPSESEEILTMDEEEKRIILRALSITGGNISEAARRLGLHRSTLHRKMARYGLATEEELNADLQKAE